MEIFCSSLRWVQTPTDAVAKRSKIESVKKKYTDFVKRRRLDFTIDRSGPLVETNHWSNPGESQNFLSLVFSFETCRNNISHDCTIMGHAKHYEKQRLSKKWRDQDNLTREPSWRRDHVFCPSPDLDCCIWICVVYENLVQSTKYPQTKRCSQGIVVHRDLGAQANSRCSWSSA